MPGQSWTPEQDALLLGLVGAGEGNYEWARWADENRSGLGARSGDSLRKRYKRLLKESPAPEVIESEVDGLQPEFLDKKDVPPPDWREILRHAEEGSRLESEAETRQRIATVRLRGPCAITYSGDWHLGDATTKYDEWNTHIRYVLDTEGLYLAVLGDLRQNVRSFYVLERVLGQVLSPRLQARALEGLAIELTEKNKLVAMIGGNHDEEFDERLFGEALNAYIYRQCRAPLFANRGALDLVVSFDGREYEVPHLLFHKSRFRSIIHALHGAKREYQFSHPAKIVAGGHDHVPGIEYYWRYGLLWKSTEQIGGMSILLKAGTYQSSNYGWRYWGDPQPPIMPTVVFRESQNGLDMVAYPFLHQAVEALNIARHPYSREEARRYWSLRRKYEVSQLEGADE